MVIKETMRLYPPIPEFARQALSDVQLGEYVMPAGTIVMVSVFALHHDPRWFSEPDAFRPERFAKDAAQTPPSSRICPSAAARACVSATASRRWRPFCSWRRSRSGTG